MVSVGDYGYAEWLYSWVLYGVFGLRVEGRTSWDGAAFWSS